MPSESSQYHPTSLSFFYSPIYAWLFQVVSFCQVSEPRPCIPFSPPACMLHAPVHLSVLHLISDEQDTSWSFSLRSFLQSPVTPNIPLSAIFQNTPSPFPCLGLTDNLSYSHQTSDRYTVCVFWSLGSSTSAEHINNTVCECYRRRHICFPLASKELCLSPSHPLSCTSHFRAQTNYFSLRSTNQLLSQPPALRRRTSSPNTPSYSLNALSKYCLSLVRFNDSVSSD